MAWACHRGEDDLIVVKMMMRMMLRNMRCLHKLYDIKDPRARKSPEHKVQFQVTVGPEHRRLGLANRLMEGLEEISDGKNCYFVDLFVR